MIKLVRTGECGRQDDADEKKRLLDQIQAHAHVEADANHGEPRADETDRDHRLRRLEPACKRKN